MSDAKRNAQLWRLLARVRELRVERKRRALNAARDEWRRADDAVALRQAEIERHAAQRDRILQSCGHDRPTGRLWRDALRWHDVRAITMHRALASAIQQRGRAADEVANASMQLQRESIGRDDALTRARRLRAALTDID